MNDQEALRKLQAEELDILLVIRDFCEKHGITWFLEGGSALGAARHDGFIPWDDDIDIGLLRDDYERFCRLAAGGLPEGYSLHTSRDTEGFAPLFAKVYKDGTIFENAETRAAGCPQAIFVDVFPYDYLARGARERRRQVRRTYNAQRMAYLWASDVVPALPRGLVGRALQLGCTMAHHLLRMFVPSLTVLQDRYDAAATVDASGASGEVLTLVWPNMEPLGASTLLPTARRTFEGHEMPVARDLELYLETMYGDWRRIPAPEERHVHLPLVLRFSDGTSWEREAPPVSNTREAVD